MKNKNKITLRLIACLIVLTISILATISVIINDTDIFKKIFMIAVSLYGLWATMIISTELYGECKKGVLKS